MKYECVCVCERENQYLAAALFNGFRVHWLLELGYEWTPAAPHFILKHWMYFSDLLNATEIQFKMVQCGGKLENVTLL